MNILNNIFKRIIPEKRNIFIVEDNEVYAKALKSFIQNRFPIIKEIKIFRIGEMCLWELHRNPSIVIMDYFLNSKYTEAHNGLEIIKRIKAVKPKTEIILLSIQNNFDVALEAIQLYDCLYIEKNNEAFANLEKFITEIFNKESNITTN